jgi:hypothetical protein
MSQYNGSTLWGADQKAIHSCRNLGAVGKGGTSKRFMQLLLSQLDYPGKDHGVVTACDPIIFGSPKQMLRDDIQLDDRTNT